MNLYSTFVFLGKILDRLLMEQSPLTVLELGAHCGYSTVRIARALPLGARLYSVEMDQRNAAITEKIVRLAGFDDNTVRWGVNVSKITTYTVSHTPLFIQVELIVNPSDEVIPRLRTDYNLDRLDFVFMDHWKKCYLPDLQVLNHKRRLLNTNHYSILFYRFCVSVGLSCWRAVVCWEKGPWFWLTMCCFLGLRSSSGTCVSVACTSGRSTEQCWSTARASRMGWPSWFIRELNKVELQKCILKETFANSTSSAIKCNLLCTCNL